MRILFCFLFLSLFVTASQAVFPTTLGVPTPPFGITESHTMYADPSYTYNYGSGPVVYRTSSDGPYTHYIDNTAVGATDTANPYGTVATPRLTFPYNVAAGSVVEIHGGPYDFSNGTTGQTSALMVACSSAGTRSLPVFFRGANLGGAWTVNTSTDVITTSAAHGLTVGQPFQMTTTGTLPSPGTDVSYFVKTVPSSTTLTISATSGGATFDFTTTGTGTHSWTARPQFNDNLWCFGNSIILENLSVWRYGFRVRHTYTSYDLHDVVIRNCEVHGDTTEGGNGAGIEVGAWQTHSIYNIYDTLIWHNHIHHLGSITSAVENDQVGVIISGNSVQRSWIIQNELHHLGGDSIRCGNNQGMVPPYDSAFSYVGNNLLYSNRENAVDVKAIEKVVISQNQMYDVSPSSSSGGDIVSVHYMPDNVWIIFNDMHSGYSGVKSSGCQHMYIYGNVISDVVRAFDFWATSEIHFISNTITDVDNGFYNGGSMSVDHPIIGNIVNIRQSAAIPSGSVWNVRYNASSLASASRCNDNLFWTDTGTIKMWWGSSSYTSLASWKTASGKGARTAFLNPLFNNPTARNFTVTEASPASSVAAASPIFGTTVNYSYWTNLYNSVFGESIAYDMAGVARPLGVASTLGAYETGPAGPNNPPTVEITLPVDPPTVSAGTGVSFTAAATDSEDGSITSSIVWTSSIDGILHTGGSFTANLSVGSHIVTATITDSDNNTATDTLVVTVTAPPSSGAAIGALHITGTLRIAP